MRIKYRILQEVTLIGKRPEQLDQALKFILDNDFQVIAGSFPKKGKGKFDMTRFKTIARREVDPKKPITYPN